MSVWNLDGTRTSAGSLVDGREREEVLDLSFNVSSIREASSFKSVTDKVFTVSSSWTVEVESCFYTNYTASFHDFPNWFFRLVNTRIKTFERNINVKRNREKFLLLYNESTFNLMSKCKFIKFSIGFYFFVWWFMFIFCHPTKFHSSYANSTHNCLCQSRYFSKLIDKQFISV